MAAPTTEHYQSIPDEHPLNRHVAPLIAAHNHVSERMHGTAFLIAPELALTAKHVVVDYLDRIDNAGIEEKIARGGDHSVKMSFFMAMIIPISNGRRVALTVSRAYFPRTGDIAVLWLSKSNDWHWDELAPFPVLRLVPPVAGTRIEALGYPDSSAIRRPDGVVELHTWPRLSTGSIQEIHGERRDATLLNYPCFQINARLDRGMSGGPVLDTLGRVCGVISRSFELVADEEPIGYAAALWAAAVIPLPGYPTNYKEGSRFLDLLRTGRVSTVDVGKLSGGIDELNRFRIAVPPPSPSDV